jgi:FkbM family methyltransferase
MKNLLLQIIGKCVQILVQLVSKSPLWFPVSSKFTNEVRRRTIEVGHNGAKLKFHIPNDRCLYRADSLFDKEPETIEWIDGFREASVFWDVGACVGTYTVYAGVTKNARIIAVEPSVFNLEWLAKNINLNDLASNVTVIPLALSNSAQLADFRMQVTEWGGALSSFGVDYNHEGNIFNPRFQYSTIGCPIGFLVQHFQLPRPDFVKIDVDSIEHLVIEGLLPHIGSVESIAVENSRNTAVAHRCTELLNEYGFVIQKIGRANTIWRRANAVSLPA